MLINQQNLDFLKTQHSAAFEEGKANAPAPKWNMVATEVPSKGSKNLYSWLGDAPELREWVDERRAKDLKRYDYTIPNKTYESTIEILKEEITDDEVMSRELAIRQMGEQVVAHPDKLIFGLLAAGTSELCYDGQFFFDTDHPRSNGLSTQSNTAGGGGTSWYLLDTRTSLKPLIFQKREEYELQWNDQKLFDERKWRVGAEGRVAAGFGFWQRAYHSAQTLDAANFQTAFESMMSITSDEGGKIDVQPTLLVVPPSLRAEAMTVVKANTVPTTGGANINFGATELLVTSYL